MTLVDDDMVLLLDLSTRDFLELVGSLLNTRGSSTPSVAITIKDHVVASSGSCKTPYQATSSGSCKTPYRASEQREDSHWRQDGWKL